MEGLLQGMDGALLHCDLYHATRIYVVIPSRLRYNTYTTTSQLPPDLINKNSPLLDLKFFLLQCAPLCYAGYRRYPLY